MNCVNWDGRPVFKKCTVDWRLKPRPTSMEMLNVSPDTSGYAANRIITTSGK